MKGFIFSIEALAAITVLLVVLLLLTQTSITDEQHNYVIIKNQSARAIAFYTNTFPTNPTTTTLYCGSIVYTTDGIQLQQQSLCEGYS